MKASHTISVGLLLLAATAGASPDPKASAAPPQPTPAAPAPKPLWLGFLRPTLDLRPRVEFADQEGRDEAVAWTFRGRVGLDARLDERVKAFAEIEHTSAWHRDSYQAASVHGRHEGKTVIADPESTELNQAWLAYTGDEFELKGGIQNIMLENQRFVGNVGWRQNEQTYHGATFTYKGIDKAKLFYGYVYNVDNIFGSDRPRHPNDRDFDSNSHFVQATYEPLSALRLTGYSYLLDLENGGGASASNNTYGASLTGTLPAGATSLGYRFEYARQADAADSQRDYRASYLHAYSSLKWGRLSGGLGYERLGAGDGVGFQTPLATLHAFNGFADKFPGDTGQGLAGHLRGAGREAAARCPDEHGLPRLCRGSRRHRSRVRVQRRALEAAALGGEGALQGSVLQRRGRRDHRYDEADLSARVCPSLDASDSGPDRCAGVVCAVLQQAARPATRPTAASMACPLLWDAAGGPPWPGSC
jgi:hypothetical protein